MLSVNVMYKIGFYTGLCWSASFLLAMLSLTQPVFGLTGNLVGLASILVAGWMLRAMQMTDSADAQPWGVHRRWRMSLHVQMLAAVLCLFVQYMYFRYVDNGRFLTSLADIYYSPQYSEMMQQLMPDSKPQDVLDAFSKITLNELALNFFVVTSFLAIILSIPTAIVARVKSKTR